MKIKGSYFLLLGLLGSMYFQVYYLILSFALLVLIHDFVRSIEKEASMEELEIGTVTVNRMDVPIVIESPTDLNAIIEHADRMCFRGLKT